MRHQFLIKLTDGEGGEKRPLPNICHRYPKTMGLGAVIPKEDQKNIANFAISRNTDVDFISKLFVSL